MTSQLDADSEFSQLDRRDLDDRRRQIVQSFQSTIQDVLSPKIQQILEGEEDEDEQGGFNLESQPKPNRLFLLNHNSPLDQEEESGVKALPTFSTDQRHLMIDGEDEEVEEGRTHNYSVPAFETEKIPASVDKFNHSTDK